MRYRDPDCTCEIEYPGAHRRWCDHCRTEGPLPGSLADPEWEQRSNDPAVLQEAHQRIADTHPDLAHRLLIALDHLNLAQPD